jgi:hypothetical protein
MCLRNAQLPIFRSVKSRQCRVVGRAFGCEPQEKDLEPSGGRNLSARRILMEFDYIIVGAGTAGSVLAARLTEDGTKTVLLLEAGKADRSILIHVPLGFGRINQKRYFDWGYDTEPEKFLGGRVVPLPRGKVLGGTSSINGMVFVRGHAGDFDRWASNGARFTCGRTVTGIRSMPPLPNPCRSTECRAIRTITMATR